MNSLHSLEERQYKFLFLASYFNLNDYDHLQTDSKPFIGEYLKNNFANLNEESLLSYIDYLHSINLKFLIADRTTDVFKYIKPQFKFKCIKNNIDILEFDNKTYIQPNTAIYATNFFVKDPKDFRLLMYQQFSQVFSDRHFVSNGENYCLMNGNVGYIFEDSYLDWCGARMCSVPRIEETFHPFRLYLIGDEMAHHFIVNNIAFDKSNMWIFKNFHKGLPLFKTNYRLINSKKFQTKKPNELFNEMRQELDRTEYIKFIQRDYIYDANFPEDLLEELNEYMSKTAIYKFITKFIEPHERMSNFYSEIIVDRYAINKYRKLNIKIEPSTLFPSLRINDPSYIFVRPDIIQIKGTLNAFYVPKEKLFAILASNSLFGSTELLHFDIRLIPYKQSSPPKRLELETFIVNKQQKLYLTKFIFGNRIPAYLLIRGDYESSFKTLDHLKNPWVENTLLKLLNTPIRA
ncbi:p49/49k [Cryptophlebia peltastica nucleopolyhedrovirus]|uniref:p49/49k n=1 Tax=Cryptophlebia peltastica nucleopolyhedrovirus TaxID=2304025 RepID=A0A346RNN7_9ABAC|nr:p49/49k [Cryptophlebia peltastica nucleopolyhedrovirus]AXS67684.1 p49/49k [Cryptophlebia peltastica nucleopolyhedrovirus]